MTTTAESYLRAALATAIRNSTDLQAFAATFAIIPTAPGLLLGTLADGSNWYFGGSTTGHGTATYGYADAFGGTTAALLEDTDTGDTLIEYQVVTVPAGPVTFAVDLKANTSTTAALEIYEDLTNRFALAVNLSTGTVYSRASAPYVAGGLQILGASWYRVWVNGTIVGTTAQVRITPAPGSITTGDPTDAPTGSVYAARPSVAATSIALNWTSPQRVFTYTTGFIGGRNRGRLPFLEIETENQNFGQETKEGGTLTTRVTLRVHVSGADRGAGADDSQTILLFALKAIRNASDGYFNAGQDSVGPLTAGPWGFQRDATLVIEHTWDKTSYETV